MPSSGAGTIGTGRGGADGGTSCPGIVIWAEAGALKIPNAARGKKKRKLMPAVNHERDANAKGATSFVAPFAFMEA